jgi:hypothetical protein
MVGSDRTTDTTSDALSDGELRAFQLQLAVLAQNARDYPLEYALGSYELLFESRDDIELIVANLSESIADIEHRF